MTDPVIRPMQPDDLPALERLSADSFYDLDVRLPEVGVPPKQRSAAEVQAWLLRAGHLLQTDPGGCWVADDGDRLLGFATSFVREGTWCLATLAVLPGLQGKGIGSRLMAAADRASQGCPRGMLSASNDSRALRLYHLAGFVLHPQMHLVGTVDRSVIPAVTGVRDGGADDLELLGELDRGARGSSHGSSHAVMLGLWRLLVSTSGSHAGYAFLSDSGAVQLLAATDPHTASRLLWTALAEGPDHQAVRHVTAANQWAVDVGMAARLDLHPSGYLGLRGMDPPSSYLHNGGWL